MPPKPTRLRCLKRYLGSEYEIEASKGHVRDLAITGPNGYGVDVENDFKATYDSSSQKLKTIKNLKELSKKADEVILATDPDREGEAIAWHIAQILGLDIETTKRLEFHEITRDSITEAIKTPRLILNSEKTNFYDMTIDDFIMENYDPIKPQLKLELGI